MLRVCKALRKRAVALLQLHAYWQLRLCSYRVRASTALHSACRDGISHSPLEYVSPDDVAAATATLYQYLRRELLAMPSSPAVSSS